MGRFHPRLRFSTALSCERRRGCKSRTDTSMSEQQRSLFPLPAGEGVKRVSRGCQSRLLSNFFLDAAGGLTTFGAHGAKTQSPGPWPICLKGWSFSTKAGTDTVPVAQFMREQSQTTIKK